MIPYLANACNEYTQVGSLLVGYDKNGNLTSDQNGNTYVYDAQNRLVQETTKAGVIETIAYDARNRVVSRMLNGLTTTTYAYDGWNLLSEYDTYGVIDASYVQGSGDDEVLARNPTIGATSYYIQDGNNNVTTLTDGSGAVQERYTYDVFGAPTIQNSAGTTLSASAFGNRFLFTGREYIAELGLYDYRNRVYSPSLGRFLQTDLIRFQGGDINIYRYVANNPVNLSDPEGLMCFDFGKFGDEIEKNRFDLEATLGGLGATLGLGTMPKTPDEIRGLGTPKENLNPITGQPSRWANRTGNRALRTFGRTVGGRLLGGASTGLLVFEGFYDLGVIGRAAYDSFLMDDCKCPK